MDMSPFLFGLYKFVKYGVYPLTWIIGCMATALILAWLPYSPRRQPWLRSWLVAGFLLLFVTGAPIVSYSVMSILEGWYPPSQPMAGSFDAIVVLGGGIREQGTLRPIIELSDESRHRTLCGIELYQRRAAPILLMTGGDARVFGAGPREASAMKDWAVKLGVPSEAVMIEDRARTTYENAIGTRQVLGRVSSILLVTSAYHIPRATALFKKQGFDVMPYACGFHARHHLTEMLSDLSILDFVPNSKAFQRMTDGVEEASGLLVYWLAGKL